MSQLEDLHGTIEINGSVYKQSVDKIVEVNVTRKSGAYACTAWVSMSLTKNGTPVYSDKLFPACLTFEDIRHLYGGG